MKQRILSVILAVIALGAAFFGANYWRAHYLAGVTVVSLPVPKSDIPPYTLLDASLFTQGDFSTDLAGKGYALSVNDLVGKISAGTLPNGQPVSLRQAIPPAEFRLADPSLEVVAIPLDPLSGVGGQVRIGERVNLYRFEMPPVPEDQTQPRLIPMAEVIYVATVPVVAVLGADGQAAMQPFTASTPQAQGQQQQQPAVLKMLLVAAPPETMQVILQAIAMSQLQDELLWVTLATPEPAQDELMTGQMR